MSAVSNYFMVTRQIMLEYRSDQFSVVNGNNPWKQPDEYYVYKTLDGGLCYAEKPRYAESDERYFRNASLYQKFPDSGRSEWTYPAASNRTVGIERAMEAPEASGLCSEATRVVTAESGEEPADDGRTVVRTAPCGMYYDTLNVYFLRGFNMDGLDGFGIQVRTTAARECSEAGRRWDEPTPLTLLDAYLSKDLFNTERGRMLRLLRTPLYMNSKFYDSYVSFELPSAYALGYSDWRAGEGVSAASEPVLETLEYPDDRASERVPTAYRVNPNASVEVEFETCSEGSSSVRTVSLGSDMEDSPALSLTFDATDAGSVAYSTATDFFNVAMYEDSEDGSVVYYPTYGDTGSCVELDGAIMAQIESGQIPITANAYYDLSAAGAGLNDNETEEAQERLYYADGAASSSKWRVYNDLLVSYFYRQDPTSSETFHYDENYSRVIDYGSQEQNGPIAYWRSRYVPDKRVIEALDCKLISLRYVCRLANVVGGVEVVRVATLNVDATKYLDTVSNYLNVNTYKIVNRIERSAPAVISQPETVREKYVRSYYSATQLAARNVGTGGTAYPQGQMTLRLYRTSNNYLVQLFNLNSDNVRIPYDLTGPYRYKMVFPTLGSDRLSVSPNSDSAHQKLGVGTLVFYITGEQAEQIMSVPADRRYFAVTTDVAGSPAQETVLYEGKVDWL